MTVETTTNKTAVFPYLGNETTTSFPYGFLIYKDSDINVVQTSVLGVESILTLGVDYTVSGVGDAAGGAINFTAAPLSTGETLVSYRNVAETQGLDLKNQGGFLPNVIEQALDYVVMSVQQVSERVNRSIAFPISDTATGVIPSVAERANKLLAFDPSGNVVTTALSVGTIASSIVSDVMTMRASQVTSGELVQLKRHTASSVGGGGLFRGVKGAAVGTFVDNNATIIVPTGGNGSAAWLRDTDRLTVNMSGALSNGVADDSSAIRGALLNAGGGVVHAPEGKPSELALNTMSIPTGSTIDGLNIVANTPGIRALGIDAGASNVTLRNVNISTPFTGYASNFTLSTITNFSIVGCKFFASGYGILLDTGVLGNVPEAKAKWLRVQDNNVHTGDSAAISLNAPWGVVEGVMITGNMLEGDGVSTLGSGGFNIAVANAQSWVIANNISLNSRREGIHVEDNQTGGVVVGNSIKSRVDGFISYGRESAPGVIGGKPFPVVANNFTSLMPLSNVGMRVKFSAPVDAVQGIPLFGNVVNNFNVGIQYSQPLNAIPSLSAATGNTISSCTTGVAVLGGATASPIVRQTGVNLLQDTPNLFVASGPSSLGKIISDSVPTAIISNGLPGNGEMPSSCEGFGFPTATFSTSIGTVNVTTVMGALPLNRFKGRLSFRAQSSGTTDWFYISADVHWDGVTLTVGNGATLATSGGGTVTIPETNMLTRADASGVTVANTFVVAAGVVKINVTSSAARQFQFNWLEFDGEYWNV